MEKMKKTVTLKRDEYPHYSDAAIHNGIAYICGQMSLEPVTDLPIHGDIREETRRTLENLEAVLKAIGSTRDDVLSITCYMVNDEDFEGYDEVYGEFFGSNFPVRTTVNVKSLYDNLRLEINAIAIAHNE